MARRTASALLFCVLVAACDGNVLDVTVTDCCDAACKGTITQLNYPKTATSPGSFNCSGTGTLDIDVTDVTMQLTVTLSGTKILDKNENACGHMHIPLPMGLGSVDVDALKSCPAKAGPVEVDIAIDNKKEVPGPVHSHSVTKDQDGNMLLCLDVDIIPRK